MGRRFRSRAASSVFPPIPLNCLRKRFHVFGHPARFHGGLVWFELACGVFCVRARVCVCVCECARGGKGRAKFWRVVTASNAGPFVRNFGVLSRLSASTQMHTHAQMHTQMHSRTRKCTRMRARAHTRTRMRAHAHPHSLIRKSDPPPLLSDV